MFEAHTPALRLLALQELMQALHAGRLDDIVQGDKGPEAVDLLRERNFEFAVALAGREDLRIVVDIDSDSLVRSIRRLDMQRANERLMEYLIRHGATAALIQRLFKLDRVAMERLCKLLRESPRGRPPSPPVKVRDAIHAAWRELTRSEADPRLRYFRLHQRFSQYPIRVLEAVLREFEE